MPQHSFSGRIQDAIICFQDLLTLRNVILIQIFLNQNCVQSFKYETIQMLEYMSEPAAQVSK